MKFGKSYMETLASPSFPEEWRQGAIEYKHVSQWPGAGVVARRGRCSGRGGEEWQTSQ
jgi:hypothetical protein